MGRVQRTHGTGGYVRVQSYSGETAHFAGLPEVFLEPGFVARAVEDVQVVSGGVLLKLRGVDGKEEAEAIRGAVLWVARASAAPLAAGEFYAGDLCGCEVRRAGAIVGTVLAFVEGGATDLLEVRGTRGETFLVPFVDEYVGEVSVERRVLELREAFDLP